jgi:hypothetical protein
MTAEQIEREDFSRFVDEGISIYEFFDEFLVVCPKCSGLAKVVPVDSSQTDWKKHAFAPRKFVCSKCLLRNTWEGGTLTVGAPVDWCFGYELWLQISCCGENLWAYNTAHLGILERYVSAKLRERTKKGRNSFLYKLPGWLKSAKNRDEVLKAIGKLRTTLEKNSF